MERANTWPRPKTDKFDLLPSEVTSHCAPSEAAEQDMEPCCSDSCHQHSDSSEAGAKSQGPDVSVQHWENRGIHALQPNPVRLAFQFEGASSLATEMVSPAVYKTYDPKLKVLIATA